MEGFDRRLNPLNPTDYRCRDCGLRACNRSERRAIRVSMARELLSPLSLAAYAALITETDGDVEVSLDPLRELLATDHRQALEFFFLRLQESPNPPSIDRSCSTTPAYWRTTLRYPHRPTSIGRLPRISAWSSTICLRHDLLHDSLMMETAARSACCWRASSKIKAPAAQHSLVCRTGREFFQPGRPFRNHPRRKPGCSTRSPGASSPGASATRG